MTAARLRSALASCVALCFFVTVPLSAQAEPGALDAAFGSGGVVTTEIGIAHEFVTAVATQSDGKLVAAGWCSTSATTDFCLVRYESDGSLDSSFGSNGLVTTAIGATHRRDFVQAVAIQSDGKIVAAGYCLVGFTPFQDYDFCLARYNSDGSLDSSFDGDGKVITAISGTLADRAESVAIQGDGKIVAAGDCGGPFESDFCLARYNGDGSLDSSFDGDGKVITAIGTSDSIARAVAIQSDGRIVAAGLCDLGPTFNFCVARYDGDGSLDSSFGTAGVVATAAGTVSGIVEAVAIQADGKIVAVGYCSDSPADADFCLARYDGDGSLDTSFDADGKLTTAIGTQDYANAVAIQGDGKIVAAGDCLGDFCLARYNADGSLDASFDDDGKLTSAIGASDDSAQAVAIQGDGKIVAAGSCSASTDVSGFCLARYQNDGSLDVTFGLDGKVTYSTAVGSIEEATAAAIQGDGKIVAAGSCSSATSTRFCLARYDTGGSLDAGFGKHGKVLTTIGAGADAAAAVAIQSDGKIVAAGRCVVGSSGDFCLARYNGNGGRDSFFDTDGKVTTAIGDGDDAAASLAIQNDGKLVVAGRCAVGSGDDFCLARYNADGSLDTSFDTDGRITTTIGASADRAEAVAIHADGKIVAAGHCSRATAEDFCLARYASDGSVDSSFGADGRIQTAIGSDAVAAAVAIQSDGKIVAAGRCAVASVYDFCLARYDGDVTLTVTKDGTGFGIVTATGIACGTDCSEWYATGTPVTLTATAGAGSVFAGWTNCDSPSATSCTMTLSSAKSVTATFTATPTFADVPPSNPFYEYIEKLFDLGITTGCGTNASNQPIFCPSHAVPRQQLAAFLVRAKGLIQLFPATPSFADVPTSNPFFGYIERLKEQGITTGCNPPANNLFCPLEPVPRQQMAALLIRAKGLPQLFPGTPSFVDVPASNVFFGYIERLKQQGITTGCNPPANDLYCPEDDVARQQMAAFLIRAFAP